MMSRAVASPSFSLVCAHCTISHTIFLHPFFCRQENNFRAKACNFRTVVVQYTSWFLPRRWAAACVCEIRVFHKRGQVFLRSQQDQVLHGRILPIHATQAAPLNACFHQASAPRVRTKVTSLWSGLLQIANPVRCFIMTESVMNTTRGAKPQGSPRR